VKLPSNPRAVITGAASGLGRAFSVKLAARGGRILVCDVHLERAAETAKLVTNAGGTAEVLLCDVTKVTDLERAADTADRLWGGTDLLVNNAGVAAAGSVGDVALDDWEWIMRINLWGVIHGCHVFVPRMKARRFGHVLNVASSAGIACLPEMASYNVTKAGVIALSETLHAELAPYGVGAAVLCPTFFQTNLLENFRSPSRKERSIADAMLRSSKTTAEDVAETGIRGLERGKVVIIPQADGRWLWRVKRLLPGLYHHLLGKHAKTHAEELAERFARSQALT
jgi:NAD(P)-dependent dehydrogenase (short-subunit alcohol dehydrogenase family)